MHVLCAEPDPATRQVLELMLRSEGFNVRVTDEAEEADYLCRHFDFDLMTIETAMHGGWECLRGLRRAKVAVPIIVLSGLGGVEDKVRGLVAGADDYIAKPFHRDELVARIKAIVRRSHGFAASVLECGPLSLDLSANTACVNGRAVHFTRREYALLEILVLRAGQVVTKERIFDHLYGGMDEPELKIVDVFLCKLRKKLDAAGAGGLIETVWGRGFVLRQPEAAAA